MVSDKKTTVRSIAPRVFFDIPHQKDDLKIECQFEDPELADNIKPDTEYAIVGKIDRFKPGKGIVIRKANFLPSGAGGHKASAANSLANPFADASRAEFSPPSPRTPISPGNLSSITPRVFTDCSNAVRRDNEARKHLACGGVSDFAPAYGDHHA